MPKKLTPEQINDLSNVIGEKKREINNAVISILSESAEEYAAKLKLQENNILNSQKINTNQLSNILGCESLKKYKNYDHQLKQFETNFEKALLTNLENVFNSLCIEIIKRKNNESLERKIKNVPNREGYVLGVVKKFIENFVNFSNPIPEISHTINLIIDYSYKQVNNELDLNKGVRVQVIDDDLFNAVADIVIKKVDYIVLQEKRENYIDTHDTENRSLLVRKTERSKLSIFKSLLAYNIKHIKENIFEDNERRIKENIQIEDVSEEQIFEVAADLTLEFLFVMETFNTLSLLNSYSQQKIKELIWLR